MPRILLAALAPSCFSRHEEAERGRVRMLGRLVLLAALLCAGLLLPVSGGRLAPAAQTFTAETKDCVVYVTRTGDRYHRYGCRYLRRSKIATTRERAIASGYTPCRVCGGSDCEK